MKRITIISLYCFLFAASIILAQKLIHNLVFAQASTPACVINNNPNQAPCNTFSCSDAGFGAPNACTNNNGSCYLVPNTNQYICVSNSSTPTAGDTVGPTRTPTSIPVLPSSTPVPTAPPSQPSPTLGGAPIAPTNNPPTPIQSTPGVACTSNAQCNGVNEVCRCRNNPNDNSPNCTKACFYVSQLPTPTSQTCNMNSSQETCPASYTCQCSGSQTNCTQGICRLGYRSCGVGQSNDPVCSTNADCTRKCGNANAVCNSSFRCSVDSSIQPPCTGSGISCLSPINGKCPNTHVSLPGTCSTAGTICCQLRPPTPTPAPSAITPCGEEGIETSIGCVSTNPTTLFASILRLAIGLAGGIAFLLILFGGIRILTSAGNPEALNQGREIVTSAIAGLILIIFSVFILRFIGIDILAIPGFSR